MVFKVVKLRGQDTYRVFDSLDGKIYSEHPTKEEAKQEIHNLENKKAEEPVKKTKGRPKKYGSPEEARTARITKTKESNARMKLKKQQGEGFGDTLKSGINSLKNTASNVVNKIVDVGNKLINPSTAYPPCLTQIKNSFGGEIIKSITARRNPVSSLITAAMNVVSLGNFEKNMKAQPYDKLYHLSFLIHTENHSVILEKVERVNITTTINNPKGLETMEVNNIPASLSLTELIDNTQKKMGNDFLPYNANTNNCQSFAMNVLQANNLITPELTTFIKQDTSSLFSNDPFLAKVSKGLTDVGASLNVAQNGGGIKRTRKIKSKHNDIDMSQFSYLLPQAESQVRSSLGMGIGSTHVHHHHYHVAGGDIWGNIKDAFSPQHMKDTAKSVISVAMPSLGAALGAAGGSAAAGPVGGIAGGTFGGIGGRMAAEQANKAIGSGLRKHRRRKAVAMEGGSFLDSKFSLRDVAHGINQVPGIVNELKGSGLGPRPKKGSPEMAAYMNKMRGMRKKK